MSLLRKILRAGNSSALTIPENYLATLGWRPGDRVVIDIRYTKAGTAFLRVDLHDPKRHAHLDPRYENPAPRRPGTG